MKKVSVLVAFMLSWTDVFAEKQSEKENYDKKDTKVYIGLGGNVSSSSLNYSLYFQKNQGNCTNKEGGISHKESGIKKVGCDLFVGVSCGKAFFCAAELGVSLPNTEYKRSFLDEKANEFDIHQNIGTELTSLVVRNGFELSLILKFGKTFENGCKIYLLGGFSSGNIKFNYEFSENHPFFVGLIAPRLVALQQMNMHYKKRNNRFNIGFGLGKVINNRASLAVEYKHKFPSKIGWTSDKMLASAIVFQGGIPGDDDLSPRKCELKVGQHVLSVHVTYNLF
ncbi:MAG: hypothetical protein LBB21_01230 [Holosporaceae bacterium]|nr:hypothetical protein [Holosporaceae bacterium]